jgi:hypothetical protein
MGNGSGVEPSLIFPEKSRPKLPPFTCSTPNESVFVPSIR